MQYSILHEGVPIGTVELGAKENEVGEVIVTPAYSAVRPIILAASEALWAAGFLAEVGDPKSIKTSALQRAQSLPLELRDPLGAFVATDFVNIVERPNPDDLPVVFVRFRLMPAGTPSVPSQRKRDGRGSVPET
jgi:hypothetical protein